MPNDQPIAFTAEGRPVYDNTPTVVCVIVQNDKGQVLTVRRANEPGRGLLGLPGGYHMRGETWQEAGAREVLEETGIFLLQPQDLDALFFETDEYGNNLVIARYLRAVDAVGAPVDGEATEIVWVDCVGRRDDWAFPRHADAVAQYFYHHVVRPEEEIEE